MSDPAIDPELALTPGSPRAIREGCKCSADYNDDGRGRWHGRSITYWITSDCPMHSDFHRGKAGGDL